MKKKLYLTRTAKLSCFFLAILLTVGFLQDFFLRNLDQNTIHMDGYYYEEENSLDVVLLGASEVYTGFSSCLAYDRYGFTSYPYATESITADGMLLALKEITRTQKPQMILIEINSYLYGSFEKNQDNASVRKLVDNIPLSQNKINFISEFIPADTQLEYYLPIIKYHSLWSNFPEQARRMVSKIQMTFHRNSVLKGYHTVTGGLVQDFTFKEPPSEKLALNPGYEQKLREMLKYCADHHLNVAFMRTPHYVIGDTYLRSKRTNAAAEIIESYGFDFINLEKNYKDVGVEPSTDFYDIDHLNIYGTQKLTGYLCDLLQTKYGVKGKPLSGRLKQKWEEAAAGFQQLNRYCIDLMEVQHKRLSLEEDTNTLAMMKKY